MLACFIFVLVGLTLMYILWYLIPRRPLETGLIMLLIMFGVFMFASVKDDNIALQIRTYLSERFDITFFATAMTIGGLLIAVWAVYNQQRKKN